MVTKQWQLCNYHHNYRFTLRHTNNRG